MYVCVFVYNMCADYYKTYIIYNNLLYANASATVNCYKLLSDTLMISINVNLFGHIIYVNFISLLNSGIKL